MFKLYHHPQSRSTRPNWLLEELGLEAERVYVDMSEKQHKAPEFLAINPLGELPAFAEGDRVITESLAICLYLADVHGPHLVPPAGPGRADYYRWMVYPVGTIEPRGMAVYAARQSGDEEAVEQATRKLAEAVDVVADNFGDGPWLLGEQFTTADVMLGSTLMWLQMAGLLDLPPVLGAWAHRIMQRPAWQRAFGQGKGG